MLDRRQQRRLRPGHLRQRPRVLRIVLLVAFGQQPQPPRIRHYYFVPTFPQQRAHPPRVCPRLKRYHPAPPQLWTFRCRPLLIPPKSERFSSFNPSSLQSNFFWSVPSLVCSGVFRAAFSHFCVNHFTWFGPPQARRCGELGPILQVHQRPHILRGEISFPASISAPTIFRTMCFRNPLPRTS